MTEQEKLEAIHHVVHDYANLVSSGTMAVQGHHLGRQFDPPVNTHIVQAFLMNCRKMGEFFEFNPKKGYIRVKDFPTRTVAFDLPTWKSWQAHMNKQLMHVTIARVKQQKKWEGYNEIKLFLEEFMNAWKKFLRNLEEPFKSRFDSEIDKKLDSEFRELDLR